MGAQLFCLLLLVCVGGFFSFAEISLAAARKLRELDPDARLLMVSSLAYDALVDEAVAIGAKGFVFKPFERPQLLSSLEQAVK